MHVWCTRSSEESQVILKRIEPGKFESPYELPVQINPNSSVAPETPSASNEIAVQNLINHLRSSEKPCVNAIMILFVSEIQARYYCTKTC